MDKYLHPKECSIFAEMQHTTHGPKTTESDCISCNNNQFDYTQILETGQFLPFLRRYFYDEMKLRGPVSDDRKSTWAVYFMGAGVGLYSIENLDHGMRLNVKYNGRDPASLDPVNIELSAVIEIERAENGQHFIRKIERKDSLPEIAFP